jgi:hypothetical protein
MGNREAGCQTAAETLVEAMVTCKSAGRLRVNLLIDNGGLPGKMRDPLRSSLLGEKVAALEPLPHFGDTRNRAGLHEIKLRFRIGTEK